MFSKYTTKYLVIIFCFALRVMSLRCPHLLYPPSFRQRSRNLSLTEISSSLRQGSFSPALAPSRCSRQCRGRGRCVIVRYCRGQQSVNNRWLRLYLNGTSTPTARCTAQPVGAAAIRAAVMKQTCASSSGSGVLYRLGILWVGVWIAVCVSSDLHRDIQ